MEIIEYQKRVRGTLAGRFYVSSNDADSIDRLLSEKCSPHAPAHGNSRPVMVCGQVDENIYNERIKNHGAKPITDELFNSAKAASQHMGYGWDSVTQALLRAKRRGEEIAVVCGVPFRWVDAIGGVD
jgi:hypothetical protein